MQASDTLNILPYAHLDSQYLEKENPLRESMANVIGIIGIVQSLVASCLIVYILFIAVRRYLEYLTTEIIRISEEGTALELAGSLETTQLADRFLPPREVHFDGSVWLPVVQGNVTGSLGGMQVVSAWNSMYPPGSSWAIMNGLNWSGRAWEETAS